MKLHKDFAIAIVDEVEMQATTANDSELDINPVAAVIMR